MTFNRSLGLRVKVLRKRFPNLIIKKLLCVKRILNRTSKLSTEKRVPFVMRNVGLQILLNQVNENFKLETLKIYYIN